MRVFLLVIVSLCISATLLGQQRPDTSDLEEVVVRAYFKEQPLLRTPSSVSIIGTATFANQAGNSLLPALNTAPGVRMEERSPGSYRLSIRGSLVRSPFGIRNVKIYYDDFILTDAGGNTYLNVLDPANVARIEILKGPEGSVFGANSGGVVLVQSKLTQRDSSALSLSAMTGSYGLLHQNSSARLTKANYQLFAQQTYQKSQGYRSHSSMDRKTYQILQNWRYAGRSRLSALLMYSDLDYSTPGGLTLIQMNLNPKASRPATPSSPGAAEQMAGVQNRTIFGGVSHSSVLGKVKHVVAVTGSSTDFKNPFITTYETRDERSIGLRTYFEWSKGDTSARVWSMQHGLESQKTVSEKRNFINASGVPAERQDFVDFSASQSFFFSRFSFHPSERLNVEAALSLNFYKYSFEGKFPVASSFQSRTFAAQLMPRAAASFKLTNSLFWRASASRGYSPPTIEEVRPSSRILNTRLQPENGWNFETGIRFSAGNNRFYADAVIFQFDLRNAIVRRVEGADTEVFVNAGGTRQRGLETEFVGWIVPFRTTSVLRGLKLTESYTRYQFNFRDYVVNASDFSGKQITGVPKHNLVSALNVYIPFGVQMYFQHSYTSSIPLNDANTAFAEKYHLLQFKLSWFKSTKKAPFSLFTGAENLLNARYSLGNDLNAFGGRYYNPAAGRNFYFGLNLRL